MSRREPQVLLVVFFAVALLTAIRPSHGYAIWALEIFPAVLALAILIPTHRWFPLTPLAYRLILLHACVLALGAHYTYAEVPLGEWAKQLFGFERNHYDRLGHFVQGFVPAIVAREVLLRASPLERGKWLVFLVTCVCLAFSALYELIEWWVAVAVEGDDVGQEFLGTQGDVWDAQWDMLLCLLGAIASQLGLSWLHDRELERLEPPSGEPAPRP